MHQASDLQDNRLYRRYPCDLPATCRPYPVQGSAWTVGRITEQSCVGIRLTADCSVAAGALLLIRPKASFDTTSAAFVGKVVHATADEGGRHLVCHTVAFLDQDEIAQLLAGAELPITTSGSR